MYSRARFSVSSSSFLVFKEVLLDAALFVPAVAARESKDVMPKVGMTKEKKGTQIKHV